MTIEPQASTGASAAEALAAAEAPEVAVERGSKGVKWTLESVFKKASDGTHTAALADRKAIDVELNSCLQTMPVNGETDPLDWWRLYQPNFPREPRPAQKYLCIPAIGAPSGRAFSTGGSVVSCYWSLFKPDMVDKLVFLANNR